jgi:hypothetical protein
MKRGKWESREVSSISISGFTSITLQLEHGRSHQWQGV